MSQPCLHSAIPAPGRKTLTAPGRSASGLGIALINGTITSPNGLSISPFSMKVYPELVERSRTTLFQLL